MATQFYEKFFRCMPTDNVIDGNGARMHLEGLSNYDIETFNIERKALRGHAVDFPLHFM